MKKPTQEALQTAFNIVAYASLKENNESLTQHNIDVESGRIERCVEYHYRIDKKCELDYPEFVSKFLQDNYHDLVHGTKYIGDFLDDVTDDGIKDKEYYMDNVSILL